MDAKRTISPRWFWVWKWSLNTNHHMWHEIICIKFKNRHSHLKTWIRKKIITLDGEWVWLKQDARELSWCQGFSVSIRAVIHSNVDYQVLHKAYTLKRYFSHSCALKKSLLFKGRLLHLLSHNKVWNLEGLQCRAIVLRNPGQGHRTSARM